MTVRPNRRHLVAATVILAAVAGLSACENAKTRFPDKKPGDMNPTWSDPAAGDQRDTVFGPGGLDLFGGGGNGSAGQQGTTGVGVNSFLWRASLDTMAFMPLASADPFGGVIITDWYSPPESPNERFKGNVYILSKALRADGVKVSVFRQIRDTNGTWLDAPINDSVATDLENAVLTRARQLRLAVLTEK